VATDGGNAGASCPGAENTSDVDVCEDEEKGVEEEGVEEKGDWTKVTSICSFCRRGTYKHGKTGDRP
jgi:hypothetical protein